jgi:hypothetical protein
MEVDLPVDTGTLEYLGQFRYRSHCPCSHLHSLVHHKPHLSSLQTHIITVTIIIQIIITTVTIIVITTISIITMITTLSITTVSIIATMITTISIFTIVSIIIIIIFPTSVPPVNTSTE